jgi:protein O-mannosyl-transferase
MTSSPVDKERKSAKSSLVPFSDRFSSPNRQARQTPSLASPNSKRQTLILCFALIAAVFVFYASVIRNDFVAFDDNDYITDNPHVNKGLTIEEAKWAFTSLYQSNWHPVTWLSHELDVTLFGLRPVGHHVGNVLLHALNALLLFLLLQSATGFRWRSLMVAALFALHPINVESVAWAAERKTVLSTLFFLLALYAYEWYSHGPNARRYLAVMGLFALALMAKPQVITFPFLLFLWDYWPLGRIGANKEKLAQGEVWSVTKFLRSRVVLEKIPLLLLAAASAIVTMVAQKAGGAVRDFSHYSLLLRLETAVVSYVRYLANAVWPSRLVALYPHPTHLYPVWQAIGALLLLLMITVVVVRARDQKYLAMGWFWFLGSMVPMIGLVQVGVQALADRYAYISLIGLFVMIVWLVADRAKAYQISARRLAAPAVCCLLLLGLLTARQVRYWHDTQTFWVRTLALTEDNYVAHRGLAAFYYRQGKTAECVNEIGAVLAIRPEDVYSHLMLGDYERSQKNYAAAIADYQAALSQPLAAFGRVQIYGYLGYTYKEMGQPLKAKENFEESLKVDPNQSPILVELGLIAQLGGDTPTAVSDFARAMMIQPSDVGMLLLANALFQEGKNDEGNKALERAAQISDNIDQAAAQARELLERK